MKRPYPPEWVLEISDDMSMNFCPAPEITDWLHQGILNPESKLYNEEHEHLIEHSGVKFLWAECGFAKQGRDIHGQAEIVAFRASGWQKDRQEAQMIKWFGELPKALITLDARYCTDCSDEDFMALVEHELYHLAHKHSSMGPCYDADNNAVLQMRGHDVEEFHGVVQRYGASEEVQKMVNLANEGPTISRANIAHACGTCLLKLA
ncbi:putative metallopeptidase [Acinetobacter baumannii]|uniref:putative metallopeptidase n=1 Tax=Acinetobacter baumannii TaxID=470 RepID=UPI002FE50CEA